MASVVLAIIASQIALINVWNVYVSQKKKFFKVEFLLFFYSFTNNLSNEKY